MAKAEKITYSLEVVRGKSRDNMKAIVSKISQLRKRVGSMDDESAIPMREMLDKITSAISQIQGMNSELVNSAVLKVEENLITVIDEYSEKMDTYIGDKEATDKLASMLKQIVDIRYSMDASAMDADTKRSWKTFKKTHKGEYSRRDMKDAYHVAYHDAMVASGKAIMKADLLGQMVILGRLDLMIKASQNNIKQYNERIDQLQAEFATANADRKEQLDEEYNELMDAIQDEKDIMERAYGQKERYKAAEKLLKAQQAGKKFEDMQQESGITDDYLSELAQGAARQLKNEERSRKRVKEATSTYEDAMASFRGSRGNDRAHRPSLADRQRMQEEAQLDGVVGHAANSERPSLADRRNNG